MSESNFRSDEKLLKGIAVLSLGSFLFFFFVTLSGVRNLMVMMSDMNQNTTLSQVRDDPKVLGVTQSRTEDRVEVLLNNASHGEAILELYSDNPVAISGVQFHFAIPETLKLVGIVCSSQFKCIENLEDNVYSLSLFRLPDQADVPIMGKTRVVTILYDKESYGELLLNSESTDRSIVNSLGSDKNLLSSESFSLAVGRKPY